MAVDAPCVQTQRMGAKNMATSASSCKACQGGGRETQCCGAKKAVEQVGAACCLLSFQGVCWWVWFLMVALRALQLHPTGKITVCSDSEHVAGDAGCSKTMKDSWVGHAAC